MKNFLNYLIFRWGKGIVGYFKLVGRFMAFFYYFFAVKMLFKTLFSPWKRDSVFKETQGFDPKEWFNRHLLNFFSRIIGFLVKTVTLLLFVILELTWFVLSLAFFPVWLISPFLIVFLAFYLVLLVRDILSVVEIKDIYSILPAVSIILGELFLITLEVKTAKFHRLSKFLKADPSNPENGAPWFQSFCAHLLIQPENLKELLQSGSIETILNTNRLKKSEWENLALFEIERQIKDYQQLFWFHRENLFSTRPINEDWFYGWTFTLNQFSRDLRHQSGSSNSFSNKNELENLKNLLESGDGVNIVISGEAGTGKKKLVEDLALDLAKGNAPGKLIGKRILEFHIEDLLSGSNLPEEKIYLLEKALFEASSAGNVILFIPNLNNYLNTGSTEGQIGKTDVSAILMSFLENASVKIITTASPQEVSNLSQEQPGIAKYLKIISLKEPSDETILLLLAEAGRNLERKFGKLITYRALKRLFEVSDRYLNQPAMPERALDFLKETIVFLFGKDPEDHIIKETEIENYASSKIGVKIGEIQGEEKEKLEGLEEAMQAKIIGQTPAIKAVVSALKRRRLDLSNPGRPTGCFLFLGPTGVGKTHTAETLANLYFGGENRMARFDMSEYQGEDALNKLLGDSSGKIEGQFHKVLSLNPFSLILLDELEKASKSVHQLLLQVMEEGMAKTGTGQKLNFRETIIIATSNAESTLIKKLFDEAKKQNEIQKEVLTAIHKDGIFSPELLNRFDESIMFHPTTEKDNFAIAGLSLADLKNRLKDQNILINFSQNFQTKFSEFAKNSEFGARELRRILQKNVETRLAQDLLSGKVVKGVEFELPMEYLGNF